MRDLVVDTESAKVRFLQIAAGGFLGLGEETFLVPVDAVTGVETDEIWIDRSRERMRDVPRYQPELADALSYYQDVYGWWGLLPLLDGRLCPERVPLRAPLTPDVLRWRPTSPPL